MYTAAHRFWVLTLEGHRVVQPGEQHEPLIFMPRKMWDALRALLEPFVVPMSFPQTTTHAIVFSIRSVQSRETGKRVCHVPLRNDYAAFPPLDASPHPAALLKVLGARVDRVQGRRLSFAPMGYETPFHRMHDQCGLLWLRAADDGGMSARCNVVAGYIAVSVYPLVDAKCGITVKMFNLICLVIEVF